MNSISKTKFDGPLKGIILDWAGTTIDFGSFSPVQPFVEVFQEKGIDVTSEEVRAFMGTSKKDHLKAILHTSIVLEKWHLLYNQAASKKEIDEMFSSFESKELECLTRFCTLISGTQEAVKKFRKKGLKIGTTSGYNKKMMDIVLREAQKQGYVPDVVVCVDDVPCGRPAPWMCFRVAQELNVYPPASIVKVGDTVMDMKAGINAGMWCVGVAMTGNEMGLSQEEINSLEPDSLNTRLEGAKKKLYEAGAHYVVDSISQVPAIIDTINERLCNQI